MSIFCFRCWNSGMLRSVDSHPWWLDYCSCEKGRQLEVTDKLKRAAGLC